MGVTAVTLFLIEQTSANVEENLDFQTTLLLYFLV